MAIAIGKSANTHKEELIKEILLIKETKVYNMKDMRKIHRVFGHPLADKLELLMKDSGIIDNTTLSMMRKVTEKCNICNKKKKKASHPKTPLPKAREFNECLVIDLKPVKTLTNTTTASQIVYMVDEFFSIHKS